MYKINRHKYETIYEFHPCTYHQAFPEYTSYPHCTCWGNARTISLETTEGILEYLKHRFYDAWEALADN
jgi:hypothetical protein